MGKITKRSSEADMHYENRECHKERECHNRITHEVGESGGVRSRSHSRLTSTISSGASPSKSHTNSKMRSASDERGSIDGHSPRRRSSGHENQSHHHKHRAGYDRRSDHHEHASRRDSGRSKETLKSGHHASDSHRRRDNQPITGRERCYDQPRRHMPLPCKTPPDWQRGKYVRDECGSGIIPKRFDFKPSRKIWCKTPLTMYQATIGELGRKLLCREKIIPRDVKAGPPCNVCEYILPPCRGYYRKYDCLRPCEEDYVSYKQGKKTYRDRVERYWEPCLTKEQKQLLDINTYAGHNVALGIKVRRKNVDIPCW